MAKPLRYPREALPGRQRPYRTCPADFRERYIELGWETIQEHYRAGWPVIAGGSMNAGGMSSRRRGPNTSSATVAACFI